MEIETDKATVEIEASASGTLSSVSAAPGDVVPVGTTIGWILAEGEAAPPPSISGTGQAVASVVGTRLPKNAIPSMLVATTPGGQETARRVAASPKARRMAKEAGLELADQRGSGPGGEVLASDLEGAEKPHPGPVVSRIWKVMAAKLEQAWPRTPHFYLLRDLDATGLVGWLSEARRDLGGSVTYTDLLLSIAAAALARHPRLNASWDSGRLIQHPEIHLGLAVAVEDGLLVPVLHSADRLALAELSRLRHDLVERARAGRLTPADLEGGSFTLSNLGGYGVDAFLGIVNPPQGALLAIGRIADRVVPIKGVPAVRARITLGLSVDHRVADGARAAEFFQTLAGLVESPAKG